MLKPVTEPADGPGEYSNHVCQPMTCSIRPDCSNEETRGAALVETALLIALIALVALFSLESVGEAANDGFTSSAKAIEGVKMNTKLKPKGSPA